MARQMALVLNAAVCGALLAAVFGGQLAASVAAAVALPFVLALLALTSTGRRWVLYGAAGVNLLVLAATVGLLPFFWDLGFVIIVPALAFGALPPALNVWALFRRVRGMGASAG